MAVILKSAAIALTVLVSAAAAFGQTGISIPAQQEKTMPSGTDYAPIYSVSDARGRKSQLTNIIRYAHGLGDGFLQIESGVLSSNNAEEQRAALGLGGAALLEVGSAAGTVAPGDHDHDGTYETAGVNIPVGIITAEGDIIVGSGNALATVKPKGPPNTLLGVNSSGVLGYYDTITTVYGASFTADDSYSGTLTQFVAGENLAQWDTIYIKNKAGVAAAYKYSSTGADKAYPPAAVAIAAVSADAAGSFLLEGFVRHDGWGFTTNQDEGKKVYASTTPGGITLTEPATDNLAIGRVIEEGVVHFVFGAMGAATGSGQLVKAVAPQMTLKHFNRDQLSDATSRHVLTAAELSGTIINNYASSAAACEFELTVAASCQGCDAIFQLGLAQNVKIYPNGSEVLRLNSVALSASAPIVNSSPTIGESIACYTFQTGSSTWAWACKTSDTDFVEGTP